MGYFIWNIDPILVSIGPFKVHWYGVLFALAFVTGYLLIKKIYVQEQKNVNELDNLLLYMAIGTVVGARLGHCLFYDPVFYFTHPLKIFAIWEGGLASHGGGIGILISLYLYQRKHDESYLWYLDRMSMAVASGGFFIRIGNFFNSEIVGKPTTVPWAFVFERVDLQPRHPVQLYESFSYGLIFIILLVLFNKLRWYKFDGRIFGLFLISVFSARILLEFFKTKQAAYSSDFILSVGQLLSVPFVIAGLFLFVYSFRKMKN
jgi:prolipoprotein diacylglyceryl transferase